MLKSSGENPLKYIFSGEHPLKYLYTTLVPLLNLFKNAEICLRLLKNPLKSSYMRLISGATSTTVWSSITCTVLHVCLSPIRVRASQLKLARVL
jgi:hypothetical protein